MTPGAEARATRTRPPSAPRRPRGDEQAARAAAARLVTGTFGARLGSLAASMITSVLIARCLQPAGRGTYQLTTTIAGTAMALGHLSVEQAQTSLWSRTEYRAAVAANSFPLGLAIGAVAALSTLAAVTLTGLCGPMFGCSSPAPVWLAVCSVPAGIAALYMTNVLMLESRVGAANRTALAAAAVHCGGLVILALGPGVTVTSATAVWALSLALPCCLLLGRLPAGPRSCSLPVARRTVATGLGYHAGPACTYLLLRVDVFLLAAQASARMVGVYALAVGVAEIGRFATDSLAQVALSRQVQADSERAAEVTALTTRIAVLVGICSALALAALAPFAVPVVYGRPFAAAVPLLLLLLPGVFVLSIARPASVFLLRARRARYVVVPSTAGLAVNIAVNLALIPSFGAAGCCIASCAGYAVMAAVQLGLFVRVSGSRVRQLRPRADDLGFCLGAARALLGVAVAG